MHTATEKTRRYRERRFAEIAEMPKIPCQCGCGTLIAPVNTNLKPARFAHGHNEGGEATRFAPGQVSPNKGKGKGRPPCRICGRPTDARQLCAMHYARWKHNGDPMIVQTREGSQNPFYGRHHTDATRAAISAANSGERNVGWKGGVGMAPYQTTFNRKFKAMIRERDGHVCQTCGRGRREGEKAFPVHHIDKAKTNDSPGNLITLCDQCHKKVHPPRKGWRMPRE